MWRLMCGLGFGFVLLLAYRRRHSRTPTLGSKHALWLWPYLLGLLVISYMSSFGGRHWLPFGWDLIPIALLSAGSLAWACRCAHSPQQTHTLLETSDDLSGQWDGL